MATVSKANLLRELEVYNRNPEEYFILVFDDGVVMATRTPRWNALELDSFGYWGEDKYGLTYDEAVQFLDYYDFDIEEDEE